MTEKNDDNRDALLFIDTNIYLDLYRLREPKVIEDFLKALEKHSDQVITTAQVEMEFKKNRHAALFEAINILQKKLDSSAIPALLPKINAVNMIRKSKEAIEEEENLLEEKIKKILENPKEADPVYRVMHNLFSRDSEVNLHRQHNKRFRIRKSARKRFTLGYPPRKRSDSSIGDGINWEWIVYCAKNLEKDIIIVTRDSDFGTTYKGNSYLNDWLTEEFNQRVGEKRKLLLTEKLAEAFHLAGISVTDEMLKEEENILDFSFSHNANR